MNKNCGEDDIDAVQRHLITELMVQVTAIRNSIMTAAVA